MQSTQAASPPFQAMAAPSTSAPSSARAAKPPKISAFAPTRAAAAQPAPTPSQQHCPPADPSASTSAPCLPPPQPPSHKYSSPSPYLSTILNAPTTSVRPPIPTTNPRISAFASSPTSAPTPPPSLTPTEHSPPSWHTTTHGGPPSDGESALTGWACEALSQLKRHGSRSGSKSTSSQDAPEIGRTPHTSVEFDGGEADGEVASASGSATPEPGPWGGGAGWAKAPSRKRTKKEGDSPAEGTDEGAEGSGGKAKKELKQTKRAAQNRAAQRAFRERKEQHIRDLESRAAQLPPLLSELDALRARVDELERAAALHAEEKAEWERERAGLKLEVEVARSGG
ncbi:hypothetical protein JCM1840_004586 [Sporobolomyces johnsonii]